MSDESDYGRPGRGDAVAEKRLEGRTVSVDVLARPESVWAVLSDGWSYPLWVVGATHMRIVDTRWPEIGARLHHSVGVWPFMLEDRTEVEASRPERTLVLLAHGRPAGSARVRIELEPVGAGTRVSMTERVVRGPARFVPGFVQATVLGPRNIESLQRLRAIAENR